ncbi:MAG TPA: glucan 1,4-alpha-glucosidase [Pyrinomonadaceae bacterium]|nr:glucan 1,4-alpha-glucosidase [Pyrinomonadaceae bacterium]
MRVLLSFLTIALCAPTLFGQTTNNLAPGAPGLDAQWESAGKVGVGTSATLESKVWFTLQGGAMTEVYYPTVDTANVRLLQFIVVSADGKRVETETENTTQRVEALDRRALTFRQVNSAKSGAYTLTKTYTTDPARSTVLIDVEFKPRHGERLYVYYDAALGNSGMQDSAWTEDGALLASDGDKASALVFSPSANHPGSFGISSNGYFETSDGLVELRRSGRLERAYERAADGNVVQVAKIPPEYTGLLAEQGLGYSETSDASFTLALGFGRDATEALRNARQSLFKGFAATRAAYEQGWHEYMRTVRRVQAKYQRQFNMAAMVLKAHEDKTYRGAMVASLSVPWGGGENANEPNVGGYHTVWARDLYQVATAFHAMGDKAAAVRALDYLFTVQQKQDGSFPQNSWLDGRPAGGGLQMDEAAYPLILAFQLGRTDKETWNKHIKPAADFIVREGPCTLQERWEEEAGYSPSTIAAEIAGLVCAAEIARRNNDVASAHTYLQKADEWASHVESWTATRTGKYGDGKYYLRLSDDADPNDGAPLEINSNGGTYDEREIVDAGFLELVRLGIKRARDPLIIKSLAVVDRVIKVKTPNGVGWYRYNHDAYGERPDGGRYDAKAGRGRLWTLLTGERGEYELALGLKARAHRKLSAMMMFANEGLMIPEQVWDEASAPQPGFRFGEGAGSATPLAWSMAQFIRLAVNLRVGRNLDTPDIVAARYLKQH